MAELIQKRFKDVTVDEETRRIVIQKGGHYAIVNYDTEEFESNNEILKESIVNLVNSAKNL